MCIVVDSHFYELVCSLLLSYCMFCYAKDDGWDQILCRTLMQCKLHQLGIIRPQKENIFCARLSSWLHWIGPGHGLVRGYVKLTTWTCLNMSIKRRCTVFLSVPLGWIDGETVIQQDNRSTYGLRPGHHQSEGGRAWKGNLFVFKVLKYKHKIK